MPNHRGREQSATIQDTCEAVVAVRAEPDEQSTSGPMEKLYSGLVELLWHCRRYRRGPAAGKLDSPSYPQDVLVTLAWSAWTSPCAATSWPTRGIPTDCGLGSRC